ncbi:MAG: 4-hydroxybenzoate octaprenyltransferase [Rhizomicrobium sp.]
MAHFTRMSLSPQVPADALAQSWVETMPRFIRPYLQLMRLDRPIGSWLLFWPSVCGLILGAIADERSFVAWRDLYYVALFVIGTIVMRGAGCAFNDIADRKFDAKVARTRGRPIPSGRVSVAAAAALTALLCLIGLAVLTQFNALTIALGVASLFLVAAYPFMKRITWWPQAWLGLTFNWGALMGFAAESGRLDLPDALLYAGLFFWTLGYDTIYAHQDTEDDALIGVKSTARLLSQESGKWILRFYAAGFTLVLAAGFAEYAGWLFALVMLAAGAHLLWQVRHLDIGDAGSCLHLFRANRITGALFALSFAAAAWFG